MTRSKAIEWLFWHHAREGWDNFQIHRLRRMVPMPFPAQQPEPDNWWSKWCL